LKSPYLVERAKRGRKNKFDLALSKIKDIEPDEDDILQ